MEGKLLKEERDIHQQFRRVWLIVKRIVSLFCAHQIASFLCLLSDAWCRHSSSAMNLGGGWILQRKNRRRRKGHIVVPNDENLDAYLVSSLMRRGWCVSDSFMMELHRHFDWNALKLERIHNLPLYMFCPQSFFLFYRWNRLWPKSNKSLKRHKSSTFPRISLPENVISQQMLFGENFPIGFIKFPFLEEFVAHHQEFYLKKEFLSSQSIQILSTTTLLRASLSHHHIDSPGRNSPFRHNSSQLPRIPIFAKKIFLSERKTALFAKNLCDIHVTQRMWGGWRRNFSAKLVRSTLE